MKLLVLAFSLSGQVLDHGLHSGAFRSYAPGFFLSALFDR
jgi:hypothetical protein